MQLSLSQVDNNSKNKNQKNENHEHSKTNQKQSELRIDILQKLVENAKENGLTVISGTNIEEFLSSVEKDNQKWNVSLLTEDQVKEITNSYGINISNI